MRVRSFLADIRGVASSRSDFPWLVRPHGNDMYDDGSRVLPNAAIFASKSEQCVKATSH